MPKNEDGEFELILGNKQLLSMFFVVVVLLGVFFVMGYIVGRNSAPLVASETPHKTEVKPPVVESPVPKDATAPETPAPAAATPTPAASSPAPEKAPEKAQKTEAAPTAPPQTAAVEQPKSEPAPKREAKVVEKNDQSKATKARPAAPGNEPVAGATYLQLSATDKAGADKMVEVLRKNNFVAIDAEVPEKPGLYRVLVGPIPSGELNKTKVDLQAKGFPDGIRKTF